MIPTSSEFQSRKQSTERQPLSIYRHEINKTPLLTPEEEVELSTRISAGDAAARDKMVRSSLRLVITVAYQFRQFGLPIDDLVQAGNLGLLRAVEGFDPEQGNRFSTYATCWIKNSIRLAIKNSSRVVRVPAHQWNAVARTQRDPNERGALVQQAARVLDAQKRAQPLHCHRACFDFAVDKKTPNPVVSLLAIEDSNRLREGLCRLPHDQRTLVELEFGIADGRPMSLSKAATVLGLTRKRARTLRAKAFESLQVHISCATQDK